VTALTSPLAAWEEILALNPWADKPLTAEFRTITRYEADGEQWVVRDRLAGVAEKNCPVSKVLNAEITLDAKLT
jgi:hypothetical protein